MTLEPIPYAQPMPVQKNRRGLLIAFGILALCVALAFLALAGFGIYNLTRFYSRPLRGSAPPRFLVQGFVILSLIILSAGILSWGGIAMIRCRRWVGTLGFVVSAAWLLIGVVILGRMLGELIGELSWRIMQDFSFLIPFTILATALVIIPAVFLRVFTLRSVAATLEAYDSHTPWCDRRPRAVIAVGVWCAMAALLLLASIAWGMQRCFVVFVFGWEATAMAVGWAAIFALASVLCFRGLKAGWWVALIGCTLYSGSAVLTDVSYAQRPRVYNLPSTQAVYDDDLYGSSEMRQRALLINGIEMIVAWPLAAGYLVARRRDFVTVETT